MMYRATLVYGKTIGCTRDRTTAGEVSCILLLCLLLISGPPVAWGAESPGAVIPKEPAPVIQAVEKPTGLKSGNTVRVKNFNKIIAGVIVRVDPDRQPLTVITSNTGTQVVWLNDVERILPTGEFIKLNPPQVDATRAYPIYRFELVQGRAIEGAVTRSIAIEIETKGKTQKLSLNFLRPHQVGFIETKPAVSSPGLTIGSRVRCVNKGESIMGTIVGLNLYRPDDAILVQTNSGESVTLMLRDVQQIRAIDTDVVTQIQVPVPPMGSAAAKVRQHKVTTMSGRIVQGRIVLPPVFDINTGKTEVLKGLWAEIEVIERL